MLVPPNALFSVFSLIGAVLVVIPLPRHLEALSNLGTALLIVWTEVACLAQFVNSIRWNHNVENWAPTWCDFCTRLLTAADVALPATALCINRRLYMIVTLDEWINKKAFNVLFDLALGLVVPGIAVALLYVVEQYRFYIYEDIGCLQAAANVDLAYPLVYMIPLLVGSASGAYSCLTLWAVFRRQRQQQMEGAATNSVTNTGWSRRLVALGILSTLFVFVPTSISIVVVATTSPVLPWPGWSAIHLSNNLIVPVPAQQWKSNNSEAIDVELRRWTTVFLAFILFGLLGFTEDAKKTYRQYAQPFARYFGYCANFFAVNSRSGFSLTSQ
ncbi:pheromone receptor [Melanogaster broomeanus]|nr:pheromone receptor [Melanogaster broomeanus]